MVIYAVEVDEAAATPWSAASFCREEGRPTLLFEDQTASQRGDGGARSLLLTSPRRWLVEQMGHFVERPSETRVEDPVKWMRSCHRAVEDDRGLFFVGGVAGVLGFEFGWRLDSPKVKARKATTPELWVGEFDAGAVYDHGTGRWTVAGRCRRAVESTAETLRRAPGKPIIGTGRGYPGGEEISAEVYKRRVEEAVRAIYAGEFFEVNYTERFRGGWRGDRHGLYAALRERAPGDYGGMVDVQELFIASVSPEQFLCVDAAGKVVTRPIKGTRPRGESAEEDHRLARELVESEKDRAENVMIVDLMRNDLTRVCRPGTVGARAVCELHSFESVHHLVSTVCGELADSFDGLDAFLASFPAGSITGAPKLRSMEWIAENEETARGPYTGSMFYWSDHGRLDSNVLIRTAVVDGDTVEYGSGGAVVADSDPAGEYEEAMWKAASFLELLEGGDDG